MINHLIKYLKRVHFSKSSTSDVIVFDETNASLIQSVIPKGLTVSIFKTRPVEFHLTPSIILSFFKNLKYLKLTNSSESNKNSFYRIFFQLLCIYIKADLMSRNPKAIITSIDNCTKFAWLSENFHQAPCIAIQNGFRLTYDSNSQSKYYCQHLFCFGEREVVDYPKLGYKVDHFHPVGSLNLSLNFDSQLCDIKPIYDLLVVSCWRGNIGYAKDVEDSMKAMRLMDETLAQYLQNRDLKTAVIMRSERDSDQWVMPEIGMSEEDYYKSIYGDLIEIIDVNFIERNVYPVMQSADVIVAGFSTTCLIEAYAMRKKVLYMNFFGNNKYHRDFKLEVVFQGNENNYQLFETRLDELRMISNEDYLREHKDIMNHYINTSASGSTREAIESKVSDIIASAMA